MSTPELQHEAAAARLELALHKAEAEVERLREVLRGVQPYVKAKYGIPDEVCDAVDAEVAGPQRSEPALGGDPE